MLTEVYTLNVLNNKRQIVSCKFKKNYSQLSHSILSFQNMKYTRKSLDIRNTFFFPPQTCNTCYYSFILLFLKISSMRPAWIWLPSKPNLEFLDKVSHTLKGQKVSRAKASSFLNPDVRKHIFLTRFDTFIRYPSPPKLNWAEEKPKFFSGRKMDACKKSYIYYEKLLILNSIFVFTS